MVVRAALFASLCAWLCLTNVEGLVWPIKHPHTVSLKNQIAFPEHWVAQKLDHLNPQDKRTFQQRYYVNEQYWDRNSGPVFLYINGEGPVYAPPNLPDDEVVLLAQTYKGLIVTLEHRYYGKSHPFAQLTTDNLQYLSSRQALADLAVFITNFTRNLNPPHERRIFTIGGSYSGALSAWFRLKYPEVTSGSVSSSGVVNAILDFTAFDEQVAQSAGPDCADAMRQVTRLVEQAVVQGGTVKTQMKALFRASSLVDDGDFMYFLADSMAEGVQYGYQDDICLPLLNAIKNNQSILAVYVNYTTTVWGQHLGSPDEYATGWQQNTTAVEDKADRQWWYQTCTELGYFQNAPPKGSIRSALYVNMNYHRYHCQNVFGKPLWPDSDATNAYYGGAHPTATKVFFANGSQDPWQRASVLSTLSPTEPLRIISCHNCGHCVDLRGCPGGCTAPNNLQETRNEISKMIGMWLQ
jgi:pimeloyl-ACP methyl ester carboxylesterase